MVIKITTEDQFNNELIKGAGKLIIIDFSAVWCGPCRNFEPIYEKLSADNTDAVFLTIDVDDEPLKSVCEKHGVKCMPTFIFMKDGETLDKLEGADEAKFKANLNKHK